MIAFFPPNRVRLGVIVFTGTAILAFIHSFGILDWAYADNVAVSAEYRQAVTTVGILAAACAAWSAAAVANPSFGHVPLGSERRGPVLARLQVLYLTCCATAGMAAGLAPVTLVTASRSTYGRLDVVVVLAGFAALAAYVAAGYLIGCLAPGYLGAPLAVGLGYSMLFFSTSILSPIYDFDVVAGLRVPTRVSLIRLLFFAGFAVGLVVASGLWLRMRSKVDKSRSALSVIAAIAPFVLVLYLSGSYAGPRVVADQAQEVCAPEDNDLLVCVHPARSVLLDDLTTAVSDLKEAAGPRIWPYSSVIDATLESPDQDYVSVALLQIQGQSNEWLTAAQEDLAAQVAGVTTCGISGPVSQASRDASDATAAWLLAGVDGPPETFLYTTGAREQFDVLDAAQRSDAMAMIESQISRLRQCDGQRF